MKHSLTANTLRFQLEKAVCVSDSRSFPINEYSGDPYLHSLLFGSEISQKTLERVHFLEIVIEESRKFAEIWKSECMRLDAIADASESSVSIDEFNWAFHRAYSRACQLAEEFKDVLDSCKERMDPQLSSIYWITALHFTHGLQQGLSLDGFVLRRNNALFQTGPLHLEHFMLCGTHNRKLYTSYHLFSPAILSVKVLLSQMYPLSVTNVQWTDQRALDMIQQYDTENGDCLRHWSSISTTHSNFGSSTNYPLIRIRRMSQPLGAVQIAFVEMNEQSVHGTVQFCRLPILVEDIDGFMAGDLTAEVVQEHWEAVDLESTLRIVAADVPVMSYRQAQEHVLRLHLQPWAVFEGKCWMWQHQQPGNMHVEWELWQSVRVVRETTSSFTLPATNKRRFSKDNLIPWEKTNSILSVLTLGNIPHENPEDASSKNLRDKITEMEKNGQLTPLMESYAGAGGGIYSADVLAHLFGEGCGSSFPKSVLVQLEPTAEMLRNSDLELKMQKRSRETSKKEGTALVVARIKVEPKTFFSNERTLLQWMNLVIFLSVAALLLMSMGTLPARVAGLSFAVLAIVAAIYATIIYHWRRLAIKTQRPVTSYDDRIGPTGFVILIIAVIVVTTRFVLFASYDVDCSIRTQYPL
jgi:hypothetical protein